MARFNLQAFSAAKAWGCPREMLWGGRWEGGSCLGTHVRIKDFKIKKKKKKEHFSGTGSRYHNYGRDGNWFNSLSSLHYRPHKHALLSTFVFVIAKHSFFLSLHLVISDFFWLSFPSFSFILSRAVSCLLFF